MASKGVIPWNKGIYVKPELHGRQCPCGNELSFRNKQYCSPTCFYKYRYKGHITYRALHRWLERTYGKPPNCENCGSDTEVEWSNKTGIYDKVRSNWQRLCRPCHRIYDKLNDIPRNGQGKYVKS